MYASHYPTRFEPKEVRSNFRVYIHVRKQRYLPWHRTDIPIRATSKLTIRSHVTSEWTADDKQRLRVSRPILSLNPHISESVRGGHQRPLRLCLTYTLRARFTNLHNAIFYSQGVRSRLTCAWSTETAADLTRVRLFFEAIEVMGLIYNPAVLSWSSGFAGTWSRNVIAFAMTSLLEIIFLGIPETWEEIPRRCPGPGGESWEILRGRSCRSRYS